MRRAAEGRGIGANEVVDVVLAATSTAPAQAREALGALEAVVPQHVLADARLLASELVTNSVRHAALGPSSRVRFRAEAGDATLRLEVSDWGPGFEPSVPQPPSLDTSHGLGLYLVDRVATRWGVDRRRSTSVWAEIGWS